MGLARAWRARRDCLWNGQFYSAGQRSAQGCAASHSAAMAQSRASAPRAPTSWKPMGRPAALGAQGSAMPGLPARLAKAVKTAWPRGPAGWPSMMGGWDSVAG